MEYIHLKYLEYYAEEVNKYMEQKMKSKGGKR